MVQQYLNKDAMVAFCSLLVCWLWPQEHMVADEFMLYTNLTQTFCVLDFMWKKVRLHLQELKFVQNLSMVPLLTHTCLLRYSSYEILWNSTVLIKYYNLSKRHIRPYPMFAKCHNKKLKHNDIDIEATTLQVNKP